MDRRRFLLGLVTLSTPVCGVLRSAEARSPILGCRLTTGNDSERPFRLMASTRDAGAFNADNYDDRLRRLVKVLVNDFGVEPGFSFYDDGDGANALATPARLTENAGPDGTVLIGAHLLVSEGKRSCEGALRPNPKPNEGLWDMQRLDECRWTGSWWRTSSWRMSSRTFFSTRRVCFCTIPITVSEQAQLRDFQGLFRHGFLYGLASRLRSIVEIHVSQATP